MKKSALCQLLLVMILSAENTAEANTIITSWDLTSSVFDGFNYMSSTLDVVQTPFTSSNSASLADLDVLTEYLISYGPASGSFNIAGQHTASGLVFGEFHTLSSGFVAFDTTTPLSSTAEGFYNYQLVGPSMEAILFLEVWQFDWDQGQGVLLESVFDTFVNTGIPETGILTINTSMTVPPGNTYWFHYGMGLEASGLESSPLEPLSGDGVLGISFVLVPEPSALGLMVVGVLVLGIREARRSGDTQDGPGHTCF